MFMYRAITPEQEILGSVLLLFVGLALLKYARNLGDHSGYIFKAGRGNASGPLLVILLKITGIILIGISIASVIL